MTEHPIDEAPPDDDKPLAGVHVLSVAVNVPGPVAVARLVALGASATTVLPPTGDPLQQHQPQWFAELHEGHRLVTLDLKSPGDRERLDDLLGHADVFVTSHRPSALRRLGVDFATVHASHPRVCQVDIVGYPGAAAEIPGHDLTYQAAQGLIRGTAVPATIAVDLAGAERAAGEALAALVHRAYTGQGSRREVALSGVAEFLAQPVRHGLTTPGGWLGGGLPVYAVYPALEGQVALAALEPHFVRNTLGALGLELDELTAERLAAVFAGRPAAEWEAWAAEHDVPLVAVRTPQP